MLLRHTHQLWKTEPDLYSHFCPYRVRYEHCSEIQTQGDITPVKEHYLRNTVGYWKLEIPSLIVTTRANLLGKFLIVMPCLISAQCFNWKTPRNPRPERAPTSMTLFLKSFEYLTLKAPYQSGVPFCIFVSTREIIQFGLMRFQVFTGEEENPELHFSCTFIITPPQIIFHQNVTQQLSSLDDFSCSAL